RKLLIFLVYIESPPKASTTLPFLNSYSHHKPIFLRITHELERERERS
ncbi:unnamed protein product, partial [Musa textilis]